MENEFIKEFSTLLKKYNCEMDFEYDKKWDTVK